MMAQNIVAWRDENGQFQNPSATVKVSRLGPKPSSSARASCALTTVITRWTLLPFTRKPIQWWNAFWQQQQQALKDLMGNSSELRNLKASDFY